MGYFAFSCPALQKAKLFVSWLRVIRVSGNFMKTIILYILTLAGITICSCKNETIQNIARQDEFRIRQLFFDWQKQEIINEHYWANDSCNSGWFKDHHYLIWSAEMRGFPQDSNKYNFSFADLNNDNKTDGLITFTPTQCDGGTDFSRVQIQLFFISYKDKYLINDTLEFNDFASTEFDSLGFYNLDSIALNKVFGTFYVFKENDKDCCPSVKKSVTFDFLKRRLITIKSTL